MEKPETALEYYNKLLENDPTNSVSAGDLRHLIHPDQLQQAAWRRKAYALRNMGKLDKSVEELTTLLDTFYNEVDGWVELAEIYYLCNQYGSHPHNLLPKLTQVLDTITRCRRSHTPCFWHPKIRSTCSSSQRSRTRVVIFPLRPKPSSWRLI